MFNEAVFLGRFVKGPELRSKEKGEGTVSWVRFRLAVNRNYPKEEEADFLPVWPMTRKPGILQGMERQAAGYW